MRIIRLLTILTVLGCGALATSGIAAADDSLNGHYRAVVDGSRSNQLGDILLINTTCDPSGNCSGWVSTPKTWGAAIDKTPGGPWTINRTDSQGWTCADGTKAAADLVYTFAAGSLAGSITSTKVAGGCGDPATPSIAHGLQIQQCVDSPTRGVCP